MLLRGKTLDSLRVGVAVIGRGEDRVARMLAVFRMDVRRDGCFTQIDVCRIVLADVLGLRGFTVLSPDEGIELPVVLRRGKTLNSLRVGMAVIGRGEDRVARMLAVFRMDVRRNGCVTQIDVCRIVLANVLGLRGFAVLSPDEGIELPVVLLRGKALNSLRVGMAVIGRGEDRVARMLAVFRMDVRRNGCVTQIDVCRIVLANVLGLRGFTVFGPDEGIELVVVVLFRNNPAVGLNLGISVCVGEVFQAARAVPVSGVARFFTGLGVGRRCGHVVAEGRVRNLTGDRIAAVVIAIGGLRAVARAGRVVVGGIGRVAVVDPLLHHMAGDIQTAVFAEDACSVADFLTGGRYGGLVFGVDVVCAVGRDIRFFSGCAAARAGVERFAHGGAGRRLRNRSRVPSVVVRVKRAVSRAAGGAGRLRAAGRCAAGARFGADRHGDVAADDIRVYLYGGAAGAVGEFILRGIQGDQTDLDRHCVLQMITCIRRDSERHFFAAHGSRRYAGRIRAVGHVEFMLLPHCIKRGVGIGGVGAARLILCCSGVRVCAPAEKVIACTGEYGVGKRKVFVAKLQIGICRCAVSAVGVVGHIIYLFKAERLTSRAGTIILDAVQISCICFQLSQHKELRAADAEINAGRITVVRVTGIILHIDKCSVAQPCARIIAQNITICAAGAVNQVFTGFRRRELIEFHFAGSVDTCRIACVDRKRRRVVRRPQRIVSFVAGRNRYRFRFQFVQFLRGRVAF